MTVKLYNIEDKNVLDKWDICIDVMFGDMPDVFDALTLFGYDRYKITGLPVETLEKYLKDECRNFMKNQIRRQIYSDKS